MRPSSGAAACTSLLRPGRAWVDGILTRLAGDAADPTAPVERLADLLRPADLPRPSPTPATIGDGVRDAVILEVSEEALHGFQYPERLIEPALGGPDTTERAFVNFRFRLLRLAEGEDCNTIVDRLRDDPSPQGPADRVAGAGRSRIGGDCPVVGGGGYTGFEHNLYRIEIADTTAGGAGALQVVAVERRPGRARPLRRRPSTRPRDHRRRPRGDRQLGLTEFYLEALQYDELGRRLDAWSTARIATLNTDHDLELAAPPASARCRRPPTPVFFRLWNGIADIAAFTNAVESGRAARRHPARLRRAGAPATTAPATTGRSRCAPARSPTRRC